MDSTKAQECGPVEILIVEDSPTQARLLRDILQRNRYVVTAAHNGTEALTQIARRAPTLIISDIVMPEMDGYELCRRLKADERLRSVPVILLTSLNEAVDVVKGLECGADYFVFKPFDEKYLLARVTYALANRHLHETESSKMGVEIFFAGRNFSICSDRLQILNLLLSTYEAAVQKNLELSSARDELRTLNQQLEAKVKQRTAAIEQEIAERKRAQELLQQKIDDLVRAEDMSRRAKEDAERANRAKDNFLAALSHELRTPLTPVLMCAAALEQEPALDPKVRQQLGMMRRNIELEARLIDDLLDLTKASRGKLELRLSGPVDIHSLLLHTEQIVRSEARVKSIDLHFELAASEPHVVGEAARLHQVFWNLLNNAIKFTPLGGRVTVRTANPVPGQLVLTVDDTGIGIDQETLPFIFHAFEQGNVQSLKPTAGLGLGLSISKAIVDLHGGTIRAESPGPGRGAVFTVELATVTPFPAGQISTTQSKQPQSTRYRLLLVEDNEPTLAVLSALLRRQGHHVITANSVKSALHLASNHTFDVVISDIGLPDGNGIDLMLQLTNDYGLRGIALSGYGMAEDLAKTKQAGFLAHLIKPITFEQLRQVLQQIAPAA